MSNVIQYENTVKLLTWKCTFFFAICHSVACFSVVLSVLTPNKFLRSASLNRKGIFDTCSRLGPAASLPCAAATDGACRSPSSSVCCNRQEYMRHRYPDTELVAQTFRGLSNKDHLLKLRVPIITILYICTAGITKRPSPASLIHYNFWGTHLNFSFLKFFMYGTHWFSWNHVKGPIDARNFMEYW